MAKLSVLIPTYNRANKLLRLLKNIETNIVDSNIKEEIEVLISDNASEDNTQEVVADYQTDKFKITYFRQSINLRFDGNVRFLYEQANTDYVWFFADDDIMLPGAILTILEGIERYKPDVLLSSFIQPPGWEGRTYTFPNRYEIITDPKTMIELVFKCTKLSVYVMKKVSFSSKQLNELKPFYENGFYFVDLSYSVLGLRDKPKLCIVSEPLSTCDDDYIKFDFPPGVFKDMYKVFYHPFVLKYHPDMIKKWRFRSYYMEIESLFAIKTGALITDKMDVYDRGIRDMKVMMIPLIKSPRVFILFIILKMNLVNAYKKIRPAVKMVTNVYRKIL